LIPNFQSHFCQKFAQKNSEKQIFDLTKKKNKCNNFKEKNFSDHKLDKKINFDQIF